MIEQNVIVDILEDAVHAPSGDNSQPWSFSIDDNVIIVRADTERDHPILNVEGRGTYVATGALIENICIAAGRSGFSCDVRLFERAGETARIVLMPAAKIEHPLHASIRARHTHRGAYDETLSDDDCVALHIHPDAGCSVKIVTGPDAIQRIADAATLMEETALSSKKLHYEFFRSILWSSLQNDNGHSGLYIKTTELPPPVQGLFKLIRHWGVMQWFAKIGLPKIAAKSNAAVYATAGACIAVILENERREDYIAAGRTMQRLWLTATQRGLAAQPLAGLIYLAEFVSRSPHEIDVSEDLKQRILGARRELGRAFECGDSPIAMILRVGTAIQPVTARSKRRKPVIA